MTPQKRQWNRKNNCYLTGFTNTFCSAFGLPFAPRSAKLVKSKVHSLLVRNLHYSKGEVTVHISFHWLPFISMWMCQTRNTS